MKKKVTVGGSNTPEAEVDVIIVGGGPAGLSAALLLGRCCRTVILFDDNQPRNQASRAVHGFLSRDGASPGQLRRIAFRQLRPYGCVSVRQGRVMRAGRVDEGFEVEQEGGSLFRCRKLLLATGVKDVLPELPGLKEFYGRSAFHCPVCDGWEQRDKPLVVFGSGSSACHYVMEVFAWSRDVTLCTNGRGRVSWRFQRRLADLGIPVVKSPVVRLAGRGGQLREIHFEDGKKIPCQALFFSSEEKPQSDLGIQLGAKVDSHGRIKKWPLERTSVPGLFVAGNTSPGVQMVVVAAAEGAKAAYAINDELNRENLSTLDCG